MKGIVFITLDCARYDRMSFNGYDKVRHKNLEWFANNGVVYNNLYSQSVTTPPSHASWLTGLYPFEHGIRRMYDCRLHDNIVTIPQVLNDHGWTTACTVGFKGLCSEYGLDKGFEQIDEDSDLSRSWGHNKYGGAKGNDWRGWLKNFKWDKEKKLFIWLHYFFGHTESDKVIPKQYIGIGSDGGYGNDFFKNYDGKFLWFDEEWLPLIIGKFSPAEFVYVISADHGDDFGKHEIAHGSYLFEETTHIPMITRIVSNQKRMRTTLLVQTTEILPRIIGNVFNVRVPFSRFPVSYAETLIDYECKREMCFRHSIYSDKKRIVYKNPLTIGIGEQEYCDDINFEKENTDYTRFKELCNPIGMKKSDEKHKKMLKSLGYL